MRLGTNTRLTGKACEDLAANFLKRSGYKILKQNFNCRLGEIDIIAKDKGCICFIEVKGRSNLSRGLPEEQINRFKRIRLCRSALLFLKQNKLLEKNARFDVVSVNLAIGEIKLFKDAFELDGKYSY